MKSLLAVALVLIATTATAATVHGVAGHTAALVAHEAKVGVVDTAKVASYPVRHPKQTVKGLVKGVKSTVVAVAKHL